MFSINDTKPCCLPDWVILGDNSRAVFLEWLLSGEKLRTDENSIIWLRYGIRLSVTQQGVHWMIETPVLLPRTVLCLPPADAPEFALDIAKRTKYAVLEEFPFRKQTSMDLIQRIKSCGKEVLVVLMDLPRHQGSTDLIAPGRDLEQAKEAYRADGCDVSMMQNVNHLQSILHWHQPMDQVWMNKVRRYLADMDERISEIPYDYLSLEEDWQDDDGPLQEQTMDRLFSYQTSKREKGKNLWDRYAAVSRRALFPSSNQGPLTSVAKLYRECLDNPLVFWSVDRDVEEFMDKLQRAFIAALEQEESEGNYRKKTHLSGQLDEDRYFGLAARSGSRGTALNAVFSRRIKAYLCNDVKGYLQERLKQRYQQLEGMIP